MKTLSKNIEREIDQALDEVCRAARAFAWEDRRAYTLWLAQTFYFVRHSSNLLALKAALYPPEQVNKHQAALAHLREETGHDRLALQDLKSLGANIDDIPEQTEVALFYQTQYYWLTQKGPLAFTGYSLLLEELANRVGAEVGKRIVEAHGKKACGFILVHAKADIKHTADQRREFEGASEEQLATMVQNMRQSAWLYARMLENITAAIRHSTAANKASRPKLKIAA